MASIAVQWATDPASGFEIVQHNQWASLPFAAAAPPADRQPIFSGDQVVGFSGTSVDLSPPRGAGYVARIVYRGLIFQADEFGWERKSGANGYVDLYAIRHAVPATGPFEAQLPMVTVWRFSVSNQTIHCTPRRRYVDASILAAMQADPAGFEVLDYAAWAPPSFDGYAYGIWMTDAQWAALEAYECPSVESWTGDSA